MTFLGASRRVFDLSLGEMLWSRRTVFMALVVGGPVLLALIVKGVEMFGMSALRINGQRVPGFGAGAPWYVGRPLLVTRNDPGHIRNHQFIGELRRRLSAGLAVQGSYT